MEEYKDIKITKDTNIQKEGFNNLGLKKFKVIKYTKHFDSSIKDKFLNYEKIDRYINIKYFKYAFISLVFFLMYLLFFLSLEKCLEGDDICSVKFGWIKKKLKEEIFSVILFEMIFQLMIFKIISKKHLIHIIIIFTLLFLFNHGLEYYDHGYYNFFYYCILLSILNLILIPLDLMIFYKYKKNILIIFFSLYIFLIFFILIIIYNKVSNCSDWPKGLNNTFIENNELLYGCQIKFPKLCLYKLFDKVQDYTKLNGKNCVNNKNGKLLKENILKQSSSPYINNAIKRIGYPLLNKDPMCFLDSVDYNSTVLQYFYNNIVDMDDKETISQFFKEKIPEVEVDFTNIKDYKLIIDLHYNKTLSKERKILEKKSEPYSNNILILFIDSLSRANALRQLKKTTKFFEKFMSYKGNFNSKYPSENFHSFQFFKYHSFNGYTGVNFPFLFYGKNKTETNKSLITKFFKENGFITSGAMDWHFIDNVRTYHNYT